MSAPVVCPIEVIDRLLSAQDKELVDRVVNRINESLSKSTNLKPVYVDVPDCISARQDLIAVVTWKFIQVGWAVTIRENAMVKLGVNDRTWQFSLLPEDIYK